MLRQLEYSRSHEASDVYRLWVTVTAHNGNIGSDRQ